MSTEAEAWAVGFIAGTGHYQDDQPVQNPYAPECKGADGAPLFFIGYTMYEERPELRAGNLMIDVNMACGLVTARRFPWVNPGTVRELRLARCQCGDEFDVGFAILAWYRAWEALYGKGK